MENQKQTEKLENTLVLLESAISSLARSIESLATSLQTPRPLESKPIIRFARLSEHATIPTKAHPLDAGYDISSAYPYTVPARGQVCAKTDLCCEMPRGYAGKLESRSGLSSKHGIEVGAGRIDEPYTGSIGVVLHNHRDTPYEVKRGDRIAQLVLTLYGTHEVVECKPSEIADTDRGDKGFGSSGR